MLNLVHYEFKKEAMKKDMMKKTSCIFSFFYASRLTLKGDYII